MKRALALCLLLVSCSRERVRPNVLLITLDTFRADRIGPRTPNLERLSREGVSFADADSAVPLTLPSHATILSGVLPLHHGLRNNGIGSFPTDRPTLATAFAGAGYRTAAFVSAFVLDHRFGLSRGFETYDDAIVRDPNSNSSFDAERRGSETVDRALAWLDKPSERPFFAWVHLYDAHAPYAPPQPYPLTYDGEIAYVDAQVGRLLSAIDRNRTIVVIAGDHGEALGEHGEPTHGLLLYEPTLRVPLIIAGAALEPRTNREAVSLADLAPTLVSFVLHQTLAADGIALDLTRQSFQHNLYAETQYPALFGWSELGSMRNGRFKAIQSTHPEMYNLETDPHEEHNILNEERPTFHALANALIGVRSTAQAAATNTAVDDETRRKLASLGYVAPATTSPGRPRPDPGAMAPLFRVFEEANTASNENRSDEAIAKLKDLTARDPGNPVFRGSLAHALRKAGRLREAIPLYRQAVAIAPDDADAWYNLAIALQEAGLNQEAGAAIRESVRRDPQRPEAHNALGIAYLSERNPQAAEAEFAKAIEIDPRNARALTNLGNVHRGAGKLDDAAREYDRALAIAPNYPDALNGMGVVEVQRGRPRQAVDWFDRAIKASSDFYEAQLNRGIALQMAGDAAGAAAQYRDLLARLPRSSAYLDQRRAATELLSQMTPGHR
jgi:arylsulfatase A-like enzyme/Tfp pilus assembly protein PilF